MKTITALIALVLVPACASGVTAARDDVLVMEDAEVLSVTRPAVFSGILATFAEVRILAHRQETTLLAPYFSTEQVLPEVGARCIFRYEAQDIDGVIGKAPASRRRANVILDFECE